MRTFPLVLAALLMPVATVGRAFAQTQPAPAESSPKLEYFVGRFRDVTVQPANPQTAAYRFQSSPLMQWQNPISGADRAVFVWTSAGRPVALCKAHVNDVKQHYVESSVSLALEPFVMKQGDRTVWSSPEPGLTMRRVTDAGPPADREAGRLVQMRALARRYRLISVWGEEKSGEWELRLLPTPLYRYQSEPAGVIDGALFGFAQGTNPETIVVVEALQTPDGPVWQTAATRMTGYAVRGWFDDDLVLDVPAAQRPNVTGTYRYVYEKPMPYPFPKPAESPP